MTTNDEGLPILSGDEADALTAAGSDEAQAREYHAEVPWHHGPFEHCDRSPCMGYAVDKALESLPRYPGVTVKLLGGTGNVFGIIGAVARALTAEVGPDAAAEFNRAAFSAGSYDEVLQLCMRTVDVA